MLTFDTSNCVLMFKRFNAVYGRALLLLFHSTMCNRTLSISRPVPSDDVQGTKYCLRRDIRAIQKIIFKCAAKIGIYLYLQNQTISNGTAILQMFSGEDLQVGEKKDNLGRHISSFSAPMLYVCYCHVKVWIALCSFEI
jgi:hypothetical protein